MAIALPTAAGIPEAPVLLGSGGSGGDKVMAWNPGHYVKWTMTRVWDEKKDRRGSHYEKALQYYENSAWCTTDEGYASHQGIQAFVHWRNFEPRKRGQYDWTMADNIIKSAQHRCGAGNRRVFFILKLEAESQFYDWGPASGGKACAPQWVWDANRVVVNENIGVGVGHCIAAVWDPEIRAAFYDYVRAFAARYKDHPLVEGFSISGEGSKGWIKRSQDPKGFSIGEYYRVHRGAVLTLRSAAPAKLVGFGTNHYGAATWSEVVKQTCIDTPGCLFVWPDTVADRNRNFPHTKAHKEYCALSGQIGLMAGLQGAKYSWRNSPTPDDPTESAFNHCCDAQTVPTDNNGNIDSYCATHAAWSPKSTNVDGTLVTSRTIIAKLTEKRARVYSTNCPSNITKAGFKCITGAVP